MLAVILGSHDGGLTQEFWIRLGISLVLFSVFMFMVIPRIAKWFFRKLEATTTSAVYSAADQTADRGVPLGPGDTLDIRIFQLSALVGRGAPKIVTLTF